MRHQVIYAVVVGLVVGVTAYVLDAPLWAAYGFGLMAYLQVGFGFASL